MNGQGYPINPNYVPQGPSPFGNASPILILGIFIFIIPFFNYVLKWNIPSWVSGVGIFFILVGAVHSILRR